MASEDAWFEPTDSDEKNGKGKPLYPYNSTKVTESGHYQEFDDTPGNERIRTQHRTGSFQEYQATGNVVHKIIGNGYHITIKDQKVQIEGGCHVVIMKDAEIAVHGNMHLLVDGDFTQTVKGNYNLTVQGDHKTECEGAIQHTASDVVHQSTGDLTVSGNLNVRGDVKCQQTVSALGNLTAGGHLSIIGSIMAQGMVTETGGEPLPHIITGIFPGLGLMVDTVGAIEMGTPVGFLVEAGGAIEMSAGGTADLISGGATTIDAGAAVEIAGGGIVSIDGTGAVSIASAAAIAIDAPIVEIN
jgi:hypothetical protein